MPLHIRPFDKVATTDPRMHVRQVGFVIERPNDVRGDSVNVLAFGGRFDILTEALAARRKQQELAADAVDMESAAVVA